MVYNTVPKLGLPNRLKESIPIFMDEITALDKLKLGMITLRSDQNYPANVIEAANKSKPIY